jgi:hypothetical protein
VGFNPHQPRKKSKLDYVFVAAALIVAAALVLWAVLG